MLVFWKGVCICHYGVAANDNSKPASYEQGPILQRAMTSGKGTYFANLAPYPGRVEFAEMLPENCQGAIVQPIGDQGVMVLATDAQRAYSRLDQAWVATVCDKLETSLENWAPAGKGFARAGR